MDTAAELSAPRLQGEHHPRHPQQPLRQRRGVDDVGGGGGVGVGAAVNSTGHGQVPPSGGIASQGYQRRSVDAALFDDGEDLDRRLAAVESKLQHAAAAAGLVTAGGTL